MPSSSSYYACNIYLFGHHAFMRFPIKIRFLLRFCHILRHVRLYTPLQVSPVREVLSLSFPKKSFGHISIDVLMLSGHLTLPRGHVTWLSVNFRLVVITVSFVFRRTWSEFTLQIYHDQIICPKREIYHGPIHYDSC
jgi:hypothetical protein